MINEYELLKSICNVAIQNLMNAAELNTFPKERVIADFEFDFMRVCLWHTGLWSSSKRKYLALKLEKMGIIKIVKQKDYSPICVRFSNIEYNKVGYDWCKKSLIGFNYISGNGFNSYPQYTRTESGENELKRLTEDLFSKITSDYNFYIQ